MRVVRRDLLRFAAAATAAPALPRIVRAQGYPLRPVRLIVGFPPGGGTDVAARLMGQWLSERLGQPVLVENRPGAGSNIATESVVRASADGHTLLLVSTAHAINASLYDRLTYNFMRDIVPVAGFMRVPNVLEINPSLPVGNVPEFIAFAKSNPGKVNMGSGGNGTSQHLSGEMFKMMAGLDIVHVPYRGAAPALTDLVGGQVQAMFGEMPPSLEFIRAGKLRALGVTTAARSEALPDVPTVAEFLPGYESSAWYGLGAPRGTPREIVERLNADINAALLDANMKARLAALGGAPLEGSPSDFSKLIADETGKWAKVAKFCGAKVE
jgi:tripartite-type tricarboxylate transporter receptor subunit TctC